MEFETPQNLRTILLAIPVKRRCTRKFVPPRYIPGYVDSGVRPGVLKSKVKANWRINELCKKATYKTREKYDYVLEDSIGSGITQSTLTGQGTYRTDHLARPNMRYLKLNKKSFSFLGNHFKNKMDKFIDSSWNSLYNYYKKTLVDLKKKRLARRGLSAKPSKKSKKPVLSKVEKNKKIDLWLSKCANPKKVFPPKPLKKSKIANLQEINYHMNQMAEPKFTTTKYLRPSIDPNYKDPLRVSKGAKKYMLTERTKELAAAPARKLVKEFIREIGATTRGARTCKPTPRCCELAMPKKRTADKNVDFKEDPFTISPYALKAKPSARTQELAKPIERK